MSEVLRTPITVQTTQDVVEELRNDPENRVYLDMPTHALNSHDINHAITNYGLLVTVTEVKSSNPKNRLFVIETA